MPPLHIVLHCCIAVAAGHVSELLGPKGPWVFADWVNKYGPVVKVQVLDSFAVILTDPGTIMRITRKTGVVAVQRCMSHPVWWDACHPFFELTQHAAGITQHAFNNASLPHLPSVLVMWVTCMA